MNCPQCGAQVQKGDASCSLCGREINLAHIAGNLIERADEALLAGDYPRAIAGYQKAAEVQESDDLFLKLGNAYDKQGDKRAAGYYIKVLEKDFTNDKAHNLLISFYTKYSKLNDLKAWYAKAAGASAEIAAKYIKVIDSVAKFKSAPLPGADELKRGAQDDYSLWGLIKQNWLIYANIICGIIITSMGMISGMRGSEDSDGRFFDPRAIQYFVMGGMLLAIGTVLMTIKMFKKKRTKAQSRTGLDAIMQEVVNEAKKEKGS